MIVTPVSEINAPYEFPRDPKALADHFSDKIQEARLKTQNVPPVAMLFTEDRFRVIGTGPFFRGPTHLKDALACFMRAMSVEIGAIAYVFVSETWVTIVSPAKPSAPPSKDPDRIDGMVCVAEFKGKGHFVKTSQIVRDSNGTIIAFKPILIPSAPEEQSGRFVGVLE